MPARLLMACLFICWIGCSKQAPPPSAPKAEAAAPTAGTPPNATAAEPAAAPSATDDAQIAAVLGELTQAVRKYGLEQHRAPKTLEELVAGGYLSNVPQAPAGKKFAINKNLQVYLTN